MKISEIYDKYGVTPNLAEHMYRVFGVVCFIEKHWSGDDVVDWNLAKQASLLHDLGNVVKFDFEKHPEFLGDEVANIEHWKEVQKKTIEKFGPDDHIATKMMLKEIVVSQELIDVVQNKSFGESIQIKQSTSWPLKILYYADLRVLPFGVGTLEQRLEDVRNRMPKYANRPDFEDLVSACKKIEWQIQDNLDIQVTDVSDNTIIENIPTASDLLF